MEEIIDRFLMESSELSAISHIDYDNNLKEIVIYYKGDNRGYTIYEQRISIDEWSKLLELEDILFIYIMFSAKLNRININSYFWFWMRSKADRFDGFTPEQLIRTGRIKQVIQLLE